MGTQQGGREASQKEIEPKPEFMLSRAMYFSYYEERKYIHVSMNLGKQQSKSIPTWRKETLIVYPFSLVVKASLIIQIQSFSGAMYFSY